MDHIRLRTRFHSLLSLLVLVGILGPAAAGNWPNWRGPDGRGVAEPGEYPTRWSTTDGTIWSVQLPGHGTSTPTVWGDQIFVTVSDAGQNKLFSISRQGEVQWELALGKEARAKNRKASGANPSVVTDGRHLFAYFKSGDFACADLAGKLVWHQNLQEKYGQDTLWWDLGTSPVLTDEAVVVAVMQTGPSYVAAFSKATGEELWKHDRTLDAPEEAAQSYTTPLVMERDGLQQIVVAGADHITAHDAKTGAELWRVGGLNPRGERFFRSIASPVASDELVVTPYARGDTLTAVRLGGEGDVTKSHIAWHREGQFTDVPTPALKGDRLYVLNDKGRIDCLDVKTGRPFWELALERNRTSYSASPIVAGDHVYLTREDGRTFVVADRGSSAEVIATNDIGQSVIATPVLLDGRIYLRTVEALHCIGR
jgi:outer membrane protein assembly factor BamB